MQWTVRVLRSGNIQVTMGEVRVIFNRQGVAVYKNCTPNEVEQARYVARYHLFL